MASLRTYRRITAFVLMIVALSAPSIAAARQHIGGEAASTGHGAPDFTQPAVALRINLDRVLAEHAFLIVEAMRTGIRSGDDFQVAGEMLEGNTRDLLALVEAAYGPDAAEAFGRLWRNHHAYLIDYTRAVADGDDDARALAASQLEAYTADFSDLLSTANPDLDRAAVEGLIREHIEQLETIGDFGDANYGDAYPAIRATFEHMFMVGDGLTHGIVSRFDDRFPGADTAFSPALDLRMDLDRILGEHTFLAAIAMRARLLDGSDLNAAVAALDQNSAEFASKIGAIYGAQAQGEFDRLWRSHTRYYLDYVAAVADDDSAAQEAALAGLRDYRSDFSRFLANANPFLDADALESMIAIHARHLVDQVTAYAAGDFDTAYRTLREAYAHTGELAAGLGGAIADQFPGPYPDARMPGPPDGIPWLPLGAMLVVITASAVAPRVLRRAVSGHSRDRGS
jgi:hypothetical protein